MPESQTNASPTVGDYETIARAMFTGFQQRDWDSVNRILADDFKFTSQYDDHISKSAYKTRCWDPVHQIDPFEILSVMVKDNQAAVHYRGHINGTKVQNVELFTVRDRQITAIDVYFGRP